MIMDILSKKESKKNNNLILTGFRGSGKTTVGKILSRRLQKPFYDTDYLIQKQETMKINEIFTKYGEKYFRRVEQKVIKSLEKIEGSIISVGGGAPCSEKNKRILQELGIVVWLVVSPEEVMKRIRRSKRPKLTKFSFEKEILFLIEKRSFDYAALANWAIVTDGRTPEEVSDELEQFWRSIQNNNIR